VSHRPWPGRSAIKQPATFEVPVTGADARRLREALRALALPGPRDDPAALLSAQELLTELNGSRYPPSIRDEAALALKSFTQWLTTAPATVLNDGDRRLLHSQLFSLCWAMDGFARKSARERPLA
jgi:hypothetical protein